MKKILFILGLLVSGLVNAQDLTYLRLAAEQGNVEAQCELASVYARGDGVLKNPEKQFYWWQQAALSGDADAQFNTGFMYFHGYGVTKDIDKASFWYGQAAQQGVADAMFCIGLMNIDNDILTSAAYWIKKAYENGQPQAEIIWNKYELWKYDYLPD